MRCTKVSDPLPFLPLDIVSNRRKLRGVDQTKAWQTWNLIIPAIIVRTINNSGNERRKTRRTDKIHVVIHGKEGIPIRGNFSPNWRRHSVKNLFSKRDTTNRVWPVNSSQDSTRKQLILAALIYRDWKQKWLLSDDRSRIKDRTMKSSSKIEAYQLSNEANQLYNFNKP